MKNIILSLAFLCAPFILFCQTDPITQPIKTKVESFSEETGTVIEKSVEDIGKVALVSVKVLKLKNLMTGDKISGLAFAYYDKLQNILDADEIDGLVKSLTLMKGAVATARPVYTEITYKSRTGFEIGARYDIDKNVTFNTGEKKWIYHLTLAASTPQKISLKPEDFMALCGFLESAKNKL